MWFNILKVLGTKSGFAQLDFDNVVIEDEDDCKTRFIEMCKKLEQVAKETERTLPEEIVYRKSWNYPPEETRITFNETEDLEGKLTYSDILFRHYYSEIDDIPEEVICRALEMLNDGKYSNKDFIKGYRITSFDFDNHERNGRRRTSKRVWIDGGEHDAFLGFTTYIRGKDDKYSKDLYNKFSEALK